MFGTILFSGKRNALLGAGYLVCNQLATKPEVGVTDLPVCWTTCWHQVSFTMSCFRLVKTEGGERRRRQEGRDAVEPWRGAMGEDLIKSLLRPD